MSWKLLAIALVPTLAHAAPCEKPEATLWNAAATDTQLTACFGDDAAHHCLVLDVPTKAWTESGSEALPPRDQSATPPPPNPDALTYTTNIRVCATAAKDCHVFTVPGEASLPSAEVVHNADRSLVAIVAFADTLPIFDGRTEKRLANIKRLRSKTDPSFYAAWFVGDMLVVYDQISPVSQSARLFNGRTGALLGTLAGGDEVEDVFEDLGHDEHLFHSFYETSLYVQNLRTGRLVATLHLAAKRVDSVRVTPFVHITSDRARVVAMRGDAADGVVVYDVAKHRETRIPVPACK